MTDGCLMNFRWDDKCHKRLKPGKMEARYRRLYGSRTSSPRHMACVNCLEIPEETKQPSWCNGSEPRLLAKCDLFTVLLNCRRGLVSTAMHRFQPVKQMNGEGSVCIIRSDDKEQPDPRLTFPPEEMRNSRYLHRRDQPVRRMVYFKARWRT